MLPNGSDNAIAFKSGFPYFSIDILSRINADAKMTFGCWCSGYLLCSYVITLRNPKKFAVAEIK